MSRPIISSDITGAIVARAANSDLYENWTDVSGFRMTDPRIVPAAKKLSKISYEEMLELASVGAKVLQIRSVELAMNERVRVQVLSSFQDDPNILGGDIPGTLVVDEDEIVEKEVVSGIAYARDEAKITLRRVADLVPRPTPQPRPAARWRRLRQFRPSEQPSGRGWPARPRQCPPRRPPARRHHPGCSSAGVRR